MAPHVKALLPEISHGDHCCLFFSTPEDQIRVTVPFLALGLERDERSVFVGTTDEIERLRSALGDDGIDAEREIEKGRLALVSERDYLEDDRWSTEKMLAFLQRAYEAAIGEGYTALRAAGDVAWQVGPHRDFREVVYYEALLDVFFVGKRMVGMCQYPRARCPADVLSGILASHKIAAIDQDVCQNFHYLPPGLVLERDAAVREEKRVEWMTSQLLRARQAEDQILRLNGELEERVRARTAELEAANRELVTFSYSVSHDLKAPLRAIKGLGEIVLEDRGSLSDRDIEDRLRRILAAAGRMEQLIDDLLAYSRLAQVDLRLVPTDLDAELKGLFETLAPEIRERNAEIILEPPFGRVRAHPVTLRQVLQNLLTNAMKFVPPGQRPCIRLSAERKGSLVRLWVADNGIGIEPEHQERIWKVFERLHSASDYPGTGVGLAIVRRGMERMEGSAGVESVPGKGSRFWIELPASD
ncbi:MAG TPA: MEDS domain-containing protein [Planctomycetota bacterium]|nr:MEDS domain-containing protein [Planctomycetota bacterium]